MSEGMNVEVGANVDPALAGFQKLADAVGGLQGQLTGQFNAIGAAMHGITAPLAAITALIAGGGAFKHIISETIAWTMEAKRLATVLGTTTQEATAWKMALEAGAVQSDTITAAAGMMTMRIASGAEAYERYGIAVEDSQGGMRSMADIFLDVTKKADGMSNAGERNAMLAKLIGRSWREVLPAMQALRTGLEESRHMAEKFGMAVTDVGFRQVKDFQRAVHEMKEPLEAVALSIGNRLIPALTGMAHSLAKAGENSFPNVMAAVEGFLIALDGLAVALGIVWEFVLLGGSILNRLAESLLKVGVAIALFANLDWKGGMDVLRSAFFDVGQKMIVDANRTYSTIEGMTARFANRTSAAMARAKGTNWGPIAGPPEPKAGGGQMPDMSASFMKKVEDAYTRLQSDVYVPSIQQELDFWKSYEAVAKAGGDKLHDAFRTIHAKVVGLEAKAAEDRLAAQVQDADNSLAVGRYSAAERLKVAVENDAATRALYGNSSAQARASYARILAAQNAQVEEERTLNEKQVDYVRDSELQKIEARETGTRFLLEQGAISQGEATAQLQQAEKERLDMITGALEAKKVIYADDLVKTKEYEDQIALIKQESLTKQQQLQQQLFQQTKDSVTNMMAPIQGAFSSMFDGIIEGTADMNKIVTGLWKSLAKSVIGELLRIVMTKIAMAITEAAVGKVSAISQVSQNAAIAGSAAASSVASVPMAGPALAAAAYAETVALIMGSGIPLASAAGGWDLGRDNPIAQLHANEMVLPAHLANRIRAMTDPEGGGLGGSTQMTVNVHGAIDGQSVFRVLTDNSAQVVKALAELQRNGRL